MDATAKWLAIDQYGEKIIFQGATPRKALMEKLGASHAEKVYQDHKDGSTHHTGWIMQQRWFTVYKVVDLEGR